MEDEDQLAMEAEGQMPQNEEKLSDDEEDDLVIMVTIAENMIDDGGYEVIAQAEGSNDPGTVIGQFLMQLGSQISEMLPDNLKPSPRIMFAHGGWVEQVSDYLQEDYDVPKDVMDRAEIYIATAASQMGQGQGAQQQAQPVMPTEPGVV